MNHELAKKLKDAGFKSSKNFGGEQKLLIYADEAEWMSPTLSELIEACGDRFFALYRQYPERNYRADAWKGDEKALGSTPEEAVANLWLALNEKK